ncbi:MAG: hypothetical protein NVSMB6_25140 [Burkholderiaceae bacterium]
MAADDDQPRRDAYLHKADAAPMPKGRPGSCTVRKKSVTQFLTATIAGKKITTDHDLSRF